ncbi:fungal-specific transcription factor domain-containing protein [Mycotypha africana]|uniref:fungal-specific transcription factor domain-containing protein n=1 Tax=Mycotypha africana TaxID=64632 RepID=UPI002300536F|nr:fungal-specific transcription factor domain-containing protein [Mycotypha africana]KAI8981598.1 fungal-specific transcription factor domain-containing protein [Mycotypha africana]
MYSNNLQHMQQHEALPSLQPHSISPSTQEPKISTKKRPRRDRACDLCRRKKIRCDYDPAYSQNPCSSCRSYNKLCTFNEAAKKRGPPKGYVDGLEQRLKRMEKLLLDIAANGKLPPDMVKDLLQQNDSAVQQDPINDGRDGSYSSDMDSCQSNSQKSPHSASPTLKVGTEEQQQQQQNEHLLPRIECLTPNAKDAKRPFSYMGSSSGVYLLTRLFTENTGHQCSNEEKNALPRPVKGHEEDLMVARLETGASPYRNLCKILNPGWKMPPKELVDYLIKLYFEKLNTFLPIVDEEKFYEKYQKANHEPQFIPIIMAVCRAAFRLLSDGHPLLEKYNIVDRKQYFTDICFQLEQNFDLDFLEPTMEAIQVLLLQAANTDKWGSQSSDWIATSIAVKMAQDLGLHRANTQQSGITIRETESRRRIWWCAYIIDRWVCASLGRPLTISDADCDVDYPDAEGRKYVSFEYLAKLSCILGDALRGLCTPRARLMSEKGVGLENISRKLEQMLLEWKKILPTDLKLTDEELSQISRMGHSDPALKRKLNSGAGKLHLAYYAVYLLSKRPLISLGTGEESTVQMPSECQMAIRHFMGIINVIDLAELISGWSIFSYCLSNTQMLLFLNYKNADSRLVTESTAFSERFRKLHLDLEKYITEPSIIPFLDVLSKIISSNGMKSVDEQSPSTEKNKLGDIFEQQVDSMSSEIQWQGICRFSISFSMCISFSIINSTLKSLTITIIVQHLVYPLNTHDL